MRLTPIVLSSALVLAPQAALASCMAFNLQYETLALEAMDLGARAQQIALDWVNISRQDLQGPEYERMNAAADAVFARSAAMMGVAQSVSGPVEKCLTGQISTYTAAETAAITSAVDYARESIPIVREFIAAYDALP